MRILLLATFCCVLATGCAVNQLKRDQDQIREALLDLYTNQIMDNLVRTYNGMPIIQLDYTDAQGQVTNVRGGGINVEQAVTNDNALEFAAAMTQNLTRTIVTTVSGNASAENTNQVSVSATPVTTSNEVYDAYLEYMSLPDALLVSAEKPCPEVAHIWRKCGELYYWVPIEQKMNFFKLSLLTTAQRGKALLPHDRFFSVNIVDASPTSASEDPGDPSDIPQMDLTLDGKVPNDSGRLTIEFDGKTIEYPVQEYNSGLATTEVLTISFPGKGGPQDLDALKASLAKSGKLFLDHNQPSPPDTDELLKRVNVQLQQIQFNQVRRGGL